MYILETAALSALGNVREKNEDNLYFDGVNLPEIHGEIEEYLYKRVPCASPHLYGVFDGMGGHERGERASFVMAETVRRRKDAISHRKSEIPEILRKICREANEIICREMREEGDWRGTTASMLWFGRKQVYSCNLGDSPIFRYREGELEPLYQEHTERKIIEKVYGEEKVRGRKFPLTQYIGIFPEEMILEPYIRAESMEAEDCYIICSDGLTDMVSRESIRDILKKSRTCEEMVGRLLEMALKAGGRDNITIICIKVREKGKETGKNFWEKLRQRFKK